FVRETRRERLKGELAACDRVRDPQRLRAEPVPGSVGEGRDERHLYVIWPKFRPAAVRKRARAREGGLTIDIANDIALRGLKRDRTDRVCRGREREEQQDSTDHDERNSELAK